jgi:hypothetical protein
MELERIRDYSLICYTILAFADGPKENYKEPVTVADIPSET